MPERVDHLKRFFPRTADLSVKDAVDAIEREFYGTQVVGPYPQRVKQLEQHLCDYN